MKYVLPPEVNYHNLDRKADVRYLGFIHHLLVAVVLLGGGRKRHGLIEISNDILNRLNANAQSDHVWWAPCIFLRLFTQLTMSGGSRMDGKGSYISYISHMREKFQAVNEFLPGHLGIIRFDSKDNHWSSYIRAQILSKKV